MKAKEVAVIIDGRKYEYRKNVHSGASNACAECALNEMCHDSKEDILCRVLGACDGGDDGCFRPAEEHDAVRKEDGITEEKVYDYYQERSVTAGGRADMLAWMFILMMTGGLISGHAYTTFSVCAALSAVYVFCSIMQAVWQTFTSWLFLQRVKKSDVVPDDYPSWVGGGAWAFFWMKTAAISAAAAYFVYAVFP